MCIANIVTKRKVTFDSLICKCKNINDIDSTKPTLIIGWEEVKSIYGKDISILEKQINEKVFWTFDKTERRNDYEKDINAFYYFIIKDLIKNVKYSFINVITAQYSLIKRFLNFVKGNKTKYIYIDNNRFVFIYCDGVVCGISLDDLRYMDINVNKCLNILKSNSNNHIVENDSFLSIKLKRIIGDDKMIIPYLYSII